MWFVYILECSDGSLYTGITIDCERRLNEHNDSKLAAKYTRIRRPVTLVYSQEYPDRSSASKEEYRIKKLSRLDKIQLIKSLL